MSEPGSETATARTKLVEAAISLMQEKHPGQIRSREIAARAGVNYGLIHHYFGNKNAVLRAALQELVDRFIAEVPPREVAIDVVSPAPVADASPHRRLWSILANVAMDPETLLVWDYPWLRRMVAAAENKYGRAHRSDIRTRFAMATTLTLGWMTYQDFVAGALDLSEAELAAVTDRITAMIDHFWSESPDGPETAEPA